MDFGILQATDEDIRQRLRDHLQETSRWEEQLNTIASSNSSPENFQSYIKDEKAKLVYIRIMFPTNNVPTTYMWFSFRFLKSTRQANPITLALFLKL